MLHTLKCSFLKPRSLFQKLSMATLNLPKCLDASSNIPTDVRFLFASDNGAATEEVTAHKLILALASKVFEREFYGSVKEPKDDIKIVDASKDVFQVMINFIYNKEMDWSVYNFSFLSSLYYLADKYDIKDMESKILHNISDQKISTKDALDVAHLAEAYHFFPKLSKTLYDVASLCLKEDFKGRFEAVFDFFSEIEVTDTNSLVACKIMARMKTVKSSKCENCWHDPCLNKYGLTKDNFVPGARVTWVLGKGHSKINKLIKIQEGSPHKFVGFLKGGIICSDLSLRPTSYLYNCL